MAGGEVDLHRAIIKEIVREEMENRMRCVIYPREGVAHRIGESHAGY